MILCVCERTIEYLIIYSGTHTKSLFFITLWSCEYVSATLKISAVLWARLHTMGWLLFVGSLKLQVSFAEYRLFYRALLQKRPIILRRPTNRSHPIRGSDIHSGTHTKNLFFITLWSFVHVSALLSASAAFWARIYTMWHIIHIATHTQRPCFSSHCDPLRTRARHLAH